MIRITTISSISVKPRLSRRRCRALRAIALSTADKGDPFSRVLGGSASGPAAGAELARDAAGRFGDRGTQAPRGSAGQDPLGVADHSDGSDGMAGGVVDRCGDARFAEHRLVSLAGQAAVAGRLE